MKLKILTSALLLLSISCGNSINEIKNTIQEKEIILVKETRPSYNQIKNREQIKNQLQTKIKNNKPLIAHILIPLCDNENQGIVPTSPKLGNGLDLRNNLYWGVRHGINTIFKRNKKWKLKGEVDNPNSNVLKRVIYERKFKNEATVLVILDAYRGDRMKACLEDYFNALAENKMDTLLLDSIQIPLYGNADLVGFNGHNGLMDREISYSITKKNIRQKDAISISCQSKYYFNERFKKLNAYPLVVTTGNLYPGGFIIEGIIEKWGLQETDELIRQEAGNSYHRVKKCGIRGARRLFGSGF